MTKYEFLGDLSRLLSDLPEEERRQAMKYYEDYFADAGESQEQEVLKELGSPQDIAKLIQSDSPENIEYGEGSSSHMQDYVQPYRPFTQNTQNTGKQNTNQNQQTTASGHSQNNWNSKNEQNYGQAGQNQNNQYTQYSKNTSQQNTSSGYHTASASNSDKTILIIILAIITSPIWGTVLIGILSLILGIFSALLGILASLIFGGGGVAIGGIGCVFGGIIACITGEIASGMLTIGIGCVLFSAGALCCYLGIMLCIKLTPAVWREVVKGFNWCTGKINQVLH